MTVTIATYMTREEAGVGQFMAIQIVSSSAGKAAGETRIPFPAAGATRRGL